MNPPPSHCGYRRGFSLVEGMVAVVVITALLLIALPVSARLISQAKLTGCIHHLRQLSVAMAASAADRQGYWSYYRDPVDDSTYSGARNALGNKALSIGRDAAAYVKSYDVFFCPADKGFKRAYGGRDFAKQDAYSSYVCRGRKTTGSSATMLSRQIGHVAGHAVISCYFLGIPGNATHKISHHGDRWPVLFGDGHVAVIPMPEWITPESYPKLNDAPTAQIRVWRYFDGNR